MGRAECAATERLFLPGLQDILYKHYLTQWLHYTYSNLTSLQKMAAGEAYPKFGVRISYCGRQCILPQCTDQPAPK